MGNYASNQPPEQVPRESFGVSRTTLRKTYEVVEREGLIETQHGRVRGGPIPLFGFFQISL